MGSEQQWAQQLKRSRQQLRQTRAVDFDTQEAILTRNLSEDIAAMKDAYARADKKQMDSLLDHLIQTRAEIAAIALAKEHKTFGEIDMLSIEDELEAYLHDTMMLGAAVSQA